MLRCVLSRSNWRVDQNNTQRRCNWNPILELLRKKKPILETHSESSSTLAYSSILRCQLSHFACPLSLPISHTKAQIFCHFLEKIPAWDATHLPLRRTTTAAAASVAPAMISDTIRSATVSLSSGTPATTETEPSPSPILCCFSAAGLTPAASTARDYIG